MQIKIFFIAPKIFFERFSNSFRLTLGIYFQFVSVLVLLQKCRFIRSGIFVFGQVDDFSGLPMPLKLVINSGS
jgi:hypothetical protein